MSKILFSLTLLFAAATLGAQPKYGHRDPYEVLAIAAKKSAAIRTARFTVTTERKAFDGTEVETELSTAAGARDTVSPIGMRVRIEGSGGRIAVYNGDTMWIAFEDGPIDLFDDRTQAEGSAQSQTLLSLVSRLLFGIGDPFTGVVDEALEIECEGLDTIDGVVCHAMTVRMPDVDDYTGRVRRYSFGADDYVLRRLISEVHWEGLVERMTMTVSKVETDVTLPDETFSFDPVREGRSVQRVSLAASDGAWRRPVMIAAGSTAPDWTLHDPLGASVALSEMRGKVVLLDFWGTWCKPCVLALPEVQRLHQDYRDRGVEVVGVNIEHRVGADPAAMMKRKGATYRLALDGKAVVEAYGITTFPSVVVIDREGKVLHTERGGGQKAWESVRAALDAYLGAAR